MTLKEVFFGEDSGWRWSDIGPVARECSPGIAVACALGVSAFLVTNTSKFGLPAIPMMKFIDPLVLSIILGMAFRMATTKTTLFPKLIPGVLLAPILLIPLGIILYGLNFRIDQLDQLNSMSIVLMLVSLGFTILAIYVFSTVLRLSTPLAHLLAAGSAVCGASAIAIIKPVVDADPDELGTALVTNTMLVIVSMMVLNGLMPLITPEIHATVAGALLQQTGFVKMAVPQGSFQDLAMAIKSTRVGLLIFIVPIVHYLTSKRLYIPWYLVLFILVGLFHSQVHLPAQVTDVLTLVYSLIFNSALASIGLNANIVSVFKKVFLPLALTFGVFMIALAIFIGGELVFHL